MKKLIITVAIVSLTALYSKAQNTQINHGYWVTEYNIHTPASKPLNSTTWIISLFMRRPLIAN
jgi:hypothetical protein